jgi:hypothetical protein
MTNSDWHPCVAAVEHYQQQSNALLEQLANYLLSKSLISRRQPPVIELYSSPLVTTEPFAYKHKVDPNTTATSQSTKV